MSPIPHILNIGFQIDEPALWKADLSTEEVLIDDIAYNLDIPYLEKEGTDDWNLTPRNLIANFDTEISHAKKVRDCDMQFPIHIYLHKNKWIILDGVHRFTKAVMQGDKTILVKKVSPDVAERCAKK